MVVCRSPSVPIFVSATPDCRFSVMEIKWGIIPDMSGSVTMRNLMGVDTAMELAMSGRELDAVEAKSLGLVSRVCADPLVEAREFARTLITKSPDALAGIKQLYSQAWARSDEAMLKEETRLQKQILGRPNQWRATLQQPVSLASALRAAPQSALTASSTSRESKRKTERKRNGSRGCHFYGCLYVRCGSGDLAIRIRLERVARFLPLQIVLGAMAHPVIGVLDAELLRVEHRIQPLVPAGLHNPSGR